MNIFNKRSEQRKLLELLLKKSYKKQINLKKRIWDRKRNSEKR